MFQSPGQEILIDFQHESFVHAQRKTFRTVSIPKLVYGNSVHYSKVSLKSHNAFESKKVLQRKECTFPCQSAGKIDVVILFFNHFRPMFSTIFIKLSL